MGWPENLRVCALRTVLNDFLERYKSCLGAAMKPRPMEPFGSNWNVPARVLSALDMLIAAHAISTNATLVTGDKAFAQVEDLRPPVNWATDL